MKKLLVLLLALMMIATPALATCPSTWNDPNATCITQNMWWQFVSNWTYWNATTWSNFNNYDTLAQANARNASIWTSLNSANSAMLFQNGTRPMTGSLNAGGYNISNVSSPVISTDAATKGYADTGISSAETIISGWIANNNSATLSTAGSWIWTNNSATVSTVNSWVQQNSSATLQTADSHIASNRSAIETEMATNQTAVWNNLTAVNTTIQSQLTGYVPIANNSYVVSSPATSTVNNVVVWNSTNGHAVNDSGIAASSLITASTENSFKNILINPGFTVNQRVYVSGTNVSAGSPGNGYMHDRWRAGTGVTNSYVFGNTSPNAPQPITITNGTLIQTVENVNVAGGTYVLSWSGTSQARIGYGTTVAASLPSGSYAASPIVISYIPAGDYITVEYNTGTLYKPQLESGTVPTKFEFRGATIENDLCYMYYVSTLTPDYPSSILISVTSTAAATFGVLYPVPMRSTPTITIYSYALTPAKISVFGYGSDSGTNMHATYINRFGFVEVNSDGTDLIIGNEYWFSYTASAEL